MVGNIEAPVETCVTVARSGQAPCSRQGEGPTHHPNVEKHLQANFTRIQRKAVRAPRGPSASLNMILHVGVLTNRFDGCLQNGSFSYTSSHERHPRDCKCAANPSALAVIRWLLCCTSPFFSAVPLIADRLPIAMAIRLIALSHSMCHGGPCQSELLCFS